MPRIFIGIKMSEKIERLAVEWTRDKRDWPARWIKPANLHLTLVPPFYEDNLEMVMARLAEIKIFKAPVVLNFHTISFGPRPPDYRLIWAVGESSAALEKLKIAIERKLDLKLENKKLFTHLTLARFRSEDYNKFRMKNLNEKISWQEEVNGFVIFESILRPGGAEYRIISKYNASLAN